VKKLLIALLIATISSGLILTTCAKENKKSEPQTDDDADDTDDDQQPYCDDPKLTDAALLKPGPLDDGKTWVITDGRSVTPVGTLIETSFFPMDSVISPDGKYAYVLCSGNSQRGVDVIDLETLQVVGQARKNSFNGIALSADGTKLYFSGANDGKAYEYLVNGSQLTFSREFDVSSFPAGLALSPDESYLLVCSNTGNRLNKIDLSTGQQVAVLGTQVYPYAVAVDSALNRAFVSNWGSDSVTAVDLGSFTAISNITVGKNPEGIAISPDGKKVYVANSDTDTISVIDAQSLSVKNTIDIHDDEVKTNGASPTHMSLSKDGKKLYVGCAGYNSVYVVSTETNKILGRIPGAWYSTSARFTPDGSKLIITNGKGLGAGANPDSTGTTHLMYGYVQVLDPPDDATLAKYTQQVIDNEKRASKFYDQFGKDCIFPVPFKRGEKSQLIKHVVYIMKENKTLDQILGDFEGDADVDPSLLIFGEQITPNAHKLAHQFTLGDNFYSKAEVSVQGHLWGTAANCNDYVEKTFLATSRDPISGVEHAAKPAYGFIFHDCYYNNVDFRVYGEIVGTAGDFDIFGPYIDFNYGFWNTSVPDVEKAKEFLREFNEGIFPSFVYILLPNDHTVGSNAGAPTPRYMVADNDAALGMIIDAISKSKYWKETAIFVTEDDPQSGADHIEAHRTLSLVISPWAKRGYVSHVIYTMDSMWMTIEMILGLPPMSTYDRYTAPMYDCFTTDADFSTYDAIPIQIPYEENPGKGPYSDYCAKLDFGAPDQVPNMGEILWAIYRPNEAFPKDLSVDTKKLDEDELKENAEEAVLYKQAVKRHIALGERLKKEGKLDIEYIKAFYKNFEKAHKK